MRVAIFFSVILAFVLAAAALPTSLPAEAGAPAVHREIVRSAHDVKTTVAALEAALRRRGVETVVKVERPSGKGTATLVMFVDPAHGPNDSGYAMDEIEPRLRALVSEDGQGAAIAFDDARTLARRAGLGLDDATTANRALQDAANEAADS